MQKIRLSLLRVTGIAALAAAIPASSLAQTAPVPHHHTTVSEQAAPGGNAGAPRPGAKAKTPRTNCWLLPLWGTDCTGKDKNADINSFYDTAGQFSFFKQIKSDYNGSSQSAKISADIASLNFSNATQLTLQTNVVAGSAGATPTAVGTVPTLTTAGAGQATQNILGGGTFVASAIYPLIALRAASISDTVGNFGAVLYASAREGVDIQNFKSNTNTTATSPPSHTNAGVEGYLQYNSINTKTDDAAKGFDGAVFMGGSYGYNLMSHGYARDYGFADAVSNRVGQVSFGVLISGVARIAISRGFGPSQTYIDSVTKSQVTVNNFKAWSFGITYQASAGK